MENNDEDKSKITLTNIDDVDRYLTSPIPDKEKLKFLKEERLRTIELIEYEYNAIYSYENSDVYQKHMEKIFEEIKKDLNWEIPACLVSAVVAIPSTYMFIYYANNPNFLGFITGLAIGSVSLSACLYSLLMGIEDIRDYNRYSKQLKLNNKLIEEKAK